MSNRDVVARRENAIKAYRLRKAGLSNAEIADALGLSVSTVTTGLARAAREAREMVSDGELADLLALEMSRLDDLQRAQWDNAMAGDVRACEAVLKVMAHRAKLLGLDERKDTPTTVQAVVVTGDQDDYVNALKKIAAGG